jgi:hypothetical protein
VNPWLSAADVFAPSSKSFSTAEKSPSDALEIRAVAPLTFRFSRAMDIISQKITSVLTGPVVARLGNPKLFKTI